MAAVTLLVQAQPPGTRAGLQRLPARATDARRLRPPPRLTLQSVRGACTNSVHLPWTPGGSAGDHREAPGSVTEHLPREPLLGRPMGRGGGRHGSPLSDEEWISSAPSAREALRGWHEYATMGYACTGESAGGKAGVSMVLEAQERLPLSPRPAPRPPPRVGPLGPSWSPARSHRSALVWPERRARRGLEL
jgi:hypothetical protein